MTKTMFKVYDNIRIVILICILCFFSIQAYSKVGNSNSSKPQNIVLSLPVYNQSTNELSFNWNPKEYLGAEFVNILIYEISAPDLKLISNNKCRNIGEFQINLHNTGINSKSDLIYKIVYKSQDGKENFTDPILFNVIPECLKPTGGNIVSKAENEYRISWDSIMESPKTYYYKIKILELLENQTRIISENEIVGKNNFTLSNIDTKYDHQVYIQRVCLEDKGKLKFYSEWVLIGNIKAIKDTRTIVCGTAVLDDPCRGTFSGTFNFFQLYLKGFTINIDTWSGDNVNGWTGTGHMELPFINRFLAVEWTANVVDADGRICDGIVKGVSDPLKENLYSGNISDGGAICIKPNSENEWDENGINTKTGKIWDEFGFDINGTYVKPPYNGDNPKQPFDNHYDPNGFDSNGNYLDTGSPFNPAGCNRFGLDVNGQPCNPAILGPYFWLQSDPINPTTKSGEDFFDQHCGNIDELTIRPRIEFNESEIQHDVVIKRAECDPIKTELNGIFTDYNTAHSSEPNLQLERNFIFGSNDLYLNEGMHKKFQAKIEKFGTTISGDVNPRDEAIKNLESKHVDLYECDLELGKILLKKQTIHDILNSTDKYNKIADVIKDEIKHFSEADAQKYSDPTAFEEWLYSEVDRLCKDEIDKAIKEEYGYQNYDSRSDEVIGFKSEKNNDNFIFKSPAIVSLDASSFKFNRAITLDDINKELLNGAKNIYGVDRAFILEQIANGSRTTFLSGGDIIENQPFDIIKESDGKFFHMYLDNITLTPEEVKADVYFILDITESGKRIVFKEENSLIGPNGPPIGGTGANAKIYLDEDIVFRINNNLRISLLKQDQQNNKTFIEWNCQGFQGINVVAKAEVCRKYLTPIDKQTHAIITDETKLVSADINIFLQSWGSLYIETHVDPFIITGLNDFKWIADEIILDLSDVQSPKSNLVQIPTGYTSPFYGNQGFSALWEGLYLKNFTVELPNKWHKNNDNITVINVSAIFDNLGLSANISANNVLSLNNGNLNGWAFSIASLNIGVFANELTGGGFGGVVNVPILKKTNCDNSQLTDGDCLTYQCTISKNLDFTFGIEVPKDGMCINMWNAGQVKIENTSFISVKYENGNFKAEATLNGQLSISHEFDGGNSIDLADIKFENLGISNTQPYFKPGHWNIPASISSEIGGFYISIDDISIESFEGNPERPGLTFFAFIALTADVPNDPKKDLGLAAGGRFHIVGKYEEDNGRQKWVYDDFRISKFCVDGSFSKAHIAGCLEYFKNDGTWGNGWRAWVDAKFEMFNNTFGLTASAQFGKKDTGKRYFYVDFFACLGQGIPLFPPINLTALGGGFYKGMKATGSLVNMDCSQPGGNDPNHDSSMPIGDTRSTVHYAIDPSVDFGFEGVLGLGKGESFYANVGFAMVFSNGSIQSVTLNGHAVFMKPPTGNISTEQTPGEPPIAGDLVANVKISLVFQPHFIFDGTLEVFINTLNHHLHGSGDHDRAVYSNLHFEKSKWYLYIGTPQERAGVTFDVASFATLSLSAYFCIGTVVPSFPDPPGEVTKYFSNFKSDNNNSGLRSSGAGFCFGVKADFNATLGNKDIAGVEAQAILGFDIMMLKYKDLTCSNSNGQIGINGWYAMGQAYILLHGELYLVGIDMIGATIAALVQVKLPNPFWARGFLHASIDTFLGDIGFDCDFTVGEQCELSPGGGNNISADLIANVSPGDKMEDLSEETYPMVTLNYKEGEKILLSDVQGNGSKNYTVVRDSLKLTSIDDPNLQYGDLKFTNNGMNVSFISKNLLKSNGHYHLAVQYSLLDESNTVIYTENESVNFKVREYVLKDIPKGNIKATYPMLNQPNFLKNEWSEHKGFISLNYGQPDILSTYNKLKLFVKIRNLKTDAEITVNANYGYSTQEISFPIPPNLLSNSSTYRLSLISRSDLKPSDPEGSQNVEETLLFSYKFKTSQYSTFTEKMDVLKAASTFVPNSFYGEFTESRIFINQYNSTASSFESFDEFETSSFVTNKIIPPADWLEIVKTPLNNYPCFGEYNDKLNNPCFAQYPPVLNNRLTDHIYKSGTYTNSDPGCAIPQEFKYVLSFNSPNLDNSFYGSLSPAVDIYKGLYTGDLYEGIVGNSKATNNPPLGPGIYYGDGYEAPDEIPPSKDAFTYIWQTVRSAQMAMYSIGYYSKKVASEDTGYIPCLDFNKGSWAGAPTPDRAPGSNYVPEMGHGVYKIEWKYTIPYKKINTTTYLQNVTY